ncbi:hypothetical protein [Pseudanabaena mucicola]|jgi:hypothetical protein|uniref:hypothetical protein n=1 Tax=Pseudanabaena mucicola TaxID=71190 RepID=UPI00257545C5|nr:hypothetical protein [Pseudanabaena mucicola]
MAVDQSAYEKAKGKKTVPNKPPEPETLNADFSHDYKAGQALAHRKLQAFNQGYRDEMSKIQDFLHTQFLTTTDTFKIEATYARSLPSSESRAIANNSFIAMLYGTEEITDHE